jgi:hypothetical protein
VSWLRTSVLIIGVAGLFLGCSEDDCIRRAEGPCGDAPCCPGLYCETRLDDCRANPLFSECKSIPAECPPGEQYVCGCDRTVYESLCHAHQASVDVGDVCGASLAPVGYFPCGPLFCEAPGHYCERLDFCDTWPECTENGYACLEWPEQCAGLEETEALCECLERVVPNLCVIRCGPVQGNGVVGIQFEPCVI